MTMSDELKAKSEEVKEEKQQPDAGNKVLNPTSDNLMMRMASFIDDHYEVRLNRLSQHYELCERSTDRWVNLDDAAIYRLMMEMNREGVAITKPYLVRAVVPSGSCGSRRRR